jgi:hypothetical protein
MFQFRVIMTDLRSTGQRYYATVRKAKLHQTKTDATGQPKPAVAKPGAVKAGTKDSKQSAASEEKEEKEVLDPEKLPAEGVPLVNMQAAWEAYKFVVA